MICREHLSQLRQEEQALEALAIQVVVVTFQGGAVVRAYAEETNLRWPILVDQSRLLYRAYGMERGSVWAVWGPASWGSYVKLLLKGRQLRRPSGDVHQLGGDVLIDPEGVVRLCHVSRIPADRPTLSSIVEIVRKDAT